jgi:hypothetical protein
MLYEVGALGGCTSLALFMMIDTTAENQPHILRTVHWPHIAFATKHIMGLDC